MWDFVIFVLMQRILIYNFYNFYYVYYEISSLKIYFEIREKVKWTNKKNRGSINFLAHFV